MSANMRSGYSAAAVAFAVGWVLFALPWLSGAVTVPWDAKAHFFPQLQFLAHALHTGQSPAWNHNVFTGSPQIADPQSLIFSPAFLLAYLVPDPSFRQLDLYCFLLLAVAGLSVLMFFRDRGWHPAGAVVAALATSFGGSSIWRIQHIKQIETFAFFMLTFWLLSRLLERKTILSGILTGLAACMMIVEPGQVTLIGGYVLIGYTLNYWLSQPRFWTSVRQTFPALLSGGIVASVLAAGPILFTLLFILDSNRPEIPFSEAARGSLHPASLLTAVIPDLYSVSSDLPYWGPAGVGWLADYLSLNENMGEVYIGALPVLLLVAVGILRGRLWLREVRFFTLAIALLLFYAVGRYSPVFSWLYHFVPGVDMFRRPGGRDLRPRCDECDGFGLSASPLDDWERDAVREAKLCCAGDFCGRVLYRFWDCRGSRARPYGVEADAGFRGSIRRRLADIALLQPLCAALRNRGHRGAGRVHDCRPCHRQRPQPLNRQAAISI